MDTQHAKVANAHGRMCRGQVGYLVDNELGGSAKIEEFTNGGAVLQRFLEDPSLDDSLKNKRMYLEVRYAKLSSLSFPKSSDVFRLKKKGKNLSSAESATNLTTCLGKVTCNVNMGFEDFQEALMNIENE